MRLWWLKLRLWLGWRWLRPRRPYQPLTTITECTICCRDVNVNLLGRR